MVVMLRCYSWFCNQGSLLFVLIGHVESKESNLLCKPSAVPSISYLFGSQQNEYFNIYFDLYLIQNTFYILLIHCIFYSSNPKNIIKLLLFLLNAIHQFFQANKNSLPLIFASSFGKWITEKYVLLEVYGVLHVALHKVNNNGNCKAFIGRTFALILRWEIVHNSLNRAFQIKLQPFSYLLQQNDSTFFNNKRSVSTSYL